MQADRRDPRLLDEPVRELDAARARPARSPERSLTVTGRPLPSRAARATATARSGSSSSAAPAPVLQTFGHRAAHVEVDHVDAADLPRRAPRRCASRRGRRRTAGSTIGPLARSSRVDPQQLAAACARCRGGSRGWRPSPRPPAPRRGAWPAGARTSCRSRPAARARRRFGIVTPPSVQLSWRERVMSHRNGRRTVAAHGRPARSGPRRRAARRRTAGRVRARQHRRTPSSTWRAQRALAERWTLVLPHRPGFGAQPAAAARRLRGRGAAVRRAARRRRAPRRALLRRRDRAARGRAAPRGGALADGHRAGALRLAAGDPQVDATIAHGEQLYAHAAQEIPPRDFVRLFRAGVGSAHATPERAARLARARRART